MRTTRVVARAVCAVWLLGVTACDSSDGGGPAPYATGSRQPGDNGGSSQQPDPSQSKGGDEDAPPAKCSLDTPFIESVFPETPESGINTDADEGLPRLTPDELVLYFHRGTTIHRAARASRDESFGAATAVSRPNDTPDSPQPARDAFPTNGDARIYFAAQTSSLELQVAERSGGGLENPRPVLGFEPPISNSVSAPFLWKSTLFFTMAANDGQHLWSGDVGADGALLALPTKLPNVAVAGRSEKDPTLSADGLVLLYYSDAGAGAGSAGIWLATRADTSQPFSNPRALNVTGQTSRWIAPGFLSSDYCRLYVYRESEPGSNRGDLALLTRTPPPP